MQVKTGERIALIGESGCGKSITMMSVMRLLDKNGYIKDGRIFFEGKDISKITEKEMSKIRGNDIAMIFQDTMTSLNPLLTIGNQIMEPLIIHKKLSKKEAFKKGVELLKLVNIPNPEKRMKQYPHQLSGGMRQRIMIAMAMLSKPKLLIADEPTTALDVTTQAEILDLIKIMQKETGCAVILITHDLGVVAEMADRIVVMYRGQVVETQEVEQLYEQPHHPYARDLLKARPEEFNGRFSTIPGSIPNAYTPLEGCGYYSRCDRACETCKTHIPALREVKEGGLVRCDRYLGGGEHNE